jgi:hypothetical protein
MINNYDLDRLKSLGYPEDFVERMKGDPCWKGYAMLGNKKKGGRTVPNCVKIETKHSEGDIATAEMTPNFLPKKPGKGDEKNPQMSEHKLRMPRSNVIEEEANKDASRVMRLKANGGDEFAEGHEEIFESDEPNGAMIVNQLRVMREKVDIMLGLLDGTENLQPWCATKIANSSQNLASVADFLRFGVET